MYSWSTGRSPSGLGKALKSPTCTTASKRCPSAATGLATAQRAPASPRSVSVVHGEERLDRLRPLVHPGHGRRHRRSRPPPPARADRSRAVELTALVLPVQVDETSMTFNAPVERRPEASNVGLLGVVVVLPRDGPQTRCFEGMEIR